ncbi:flagella basal body P-ring formation protein FlgA [Tunturibacter empetritectus]|uniref:Flagella basal body P-ring formation protein FlgA SAF domain-containing protein n=1 Tax=Tunturiibacter empetritectus TaxID=3069691 RepID=A0A7W8IEG4_9BACT|nr:flagella basal body P-ring formation protein FlgA [Edaphobacter lichenicola]MBB5315684.1 hypothetical protein [Edaphobacter lichenicola]
MFNRFSIFKTVGRSFFLLLHGICFTNAFGVCYRTPADAIAANLETSPYSISVGGGYRVSKIQSDPVLNQSWAMIIPCDHPGWPAFAFPLRNSILPAQLKVPERATKILAPVVVRAGDTVRLWRQESSLRIEVAGTSEGNGGLGDLVKVRLLRRNTDNQSITEQFSGIVRGPFDVEMKP